MTQENASKVHQRELFRDKFSWKVYKNVTRAIELLATFMTFV